MMKWNFVPVVLGVVLFGAAPAEAQLAFGPQLSFGTDSDLGIGARVEVPVGHMVSSTGVFAAMKMIGSFDYFFIDCGDGVSDDVDCSYWELNANAAVPIPVEGFSPYAGAGLNVGHAAVDFEDDAFDDFDSSDTEAGVNLLGGINFPVGGMAAFAEGRLELGGGEQFVITAGVLF